MEGNLIVKCCKCEDYFPVEQTKKLKMKEEKVTLCMCLKCLDEVPETTEESMVVIK